MAGEAEAAASILKTLFGEKQLGAPAPAFQPGPTNFGQDNNFSGILQNMLSQSPDIESLIGSPQAQGQELAPQVLAQDSGPLGLTKSFENPVDEELLGSLQESPEQGPFGKFFGNLDQNLQSPSKLLGLSLLSQIDPRLAQGGLIAGGLFGQNKLF